MTGTGDNPWGPWPLVFIFGMVFGLIEMLATLAMVSVVFRFGPRIAASDSSGVPLPPFSPRQSFITPSAKVSVVSDSRCIFRPRLDTWFAHAGSFFLFKGTVTRAGGQTAAVSRAPVGVLVGIAGWLGAWSSRLPAFIAHLELVAILFILIGWVIVGGALIYGWRIERRRFSTVLQEVCDHLRGAG